MFWIILTFFVMLISFIRYFIRLEKETDFVVRIAFSSFVSIFFGLIFSICLCGFLPTFSAGLSYENKIFETNIYSLKSNDEINGSFFIGSGHIREKEYYYFFKEHDENGSLIRDKVVALQTPILQDSSKHPCLVQEIRVVSKYNKWFVGLTALIEGEDEYLGKRIGLESGIISNKLIVPEGTIIQEFRIE